MKLPRPELCGLRRYLNFHGCLDCPAIVEGPALQERIYFPSSALITPLTAFLSQRPRAGPAQASSHQCTCSDSSLCNILQGEHLLLIGLDWPSQWPPSSSEAVSLPPPCPSPGSVTKGNSKNVNSKYWIDVLSTSTDVCVRYWDMYRTDEAQ